MSGFDFFIIFWLVLLIGIVKAVDKWSMANVFIGGLAIYFAVGMSWPLFMAVKWLFS